MSKTYGSTWKNSSGYTHYQKNKAYYVERARLNKVRNFQYIEDIKKKSKCRDCGNDDYRLLEFDHLPGFKKDNAISNAIRKGWTFTRLDMEIAKCEVVCANCHKIRTWKRRLAPIAE